MVKKQIPVLITFDVDPCKNINLAMNKSLDLLKKVNIRSTFFYTAILAKKKMIKKLLKNRHELGCHALTHDNTEEFNKMSKIKALKIISKATKILEDLSKTKIESFRSARVKISCNTLFALEKLGYKNDSSVCSQRLDFFSSNLINLGWIFAPRKPYFPSKNSPYRKGDIKILEIPVSALILPFISTTLRIFGLTLSKILFNILYWESYYCNKPIVYLVHPHEFNYKKGEVKFSWKMLIPNKNWLITGFPLRIWLGRRLSGTEVFKINMDLLRWIKKKKYVKFYTVKEFSNLTNRHNQKESVES